MGKYAGNVPTGDGSQPRKRIPSLPPIQCQRGSASSAPLLPFSEPKSFGCGLATIGWVPDQNRHEDRMGTAREPPD